MRLDRFKFRAWITIPLTQEDGEEFDFNLYLYGIDVLSGGNFAGFDEGLLGDTLAETKLTDKQKEEARQFCEDNNIFDSDTYYCIPVDIIEQCAGLKDKNGRLMFEGDLVKCKLSRNPGVIKWDQEMGAFRLLIPPKPLFNSSLEDVVEFDFKVVGNIHENPELMEEK